MKLRINVCNLKTAVFVVSLFARSFTGAAFENTMLIDSYAAKVNDGVITVGQVMMALAPEEARLRRDYRGADLHEQLEKAFEEILDFMIERRIIVHEFKRLGMSIPDTVVDGRIDELVHNQFNRDKLALLDQLGEEGLTVREWRREIRDQIIVSIMRDREIDSRIFIPPGRVRERYERDIERYRVPPQVEMRMIVFEISGIDEEGKAEKRKRAESVRKKLLAGADFGETAKEVSSGIRAADGGYWGWIEPRSRRSELAEALEQLSPGKISDVIEVEDRLYVLTIDARKDEMNIPFSEVKQEIFDELRKEQAERLYEEWIARMRRRVYVRKFS